MGGTMSRRTLTAVLAGAAAVALSVGLTAGPRAVGRPVDRGHDPWPITECGTYSGKGCAPTSSGVDLARPAFSHPTRITNPLYPISRLRSVVLLGHVESEPFRS